LLASYNQFNPAAGVDEFHGDLVVRAGPPAEDGTQAPAVNLGMFVDYGFCFRPSAPENVPPVE